MEILNLVTCVFPKRRTRLPYTEIAIIARKKPDGRTNLAPVPSEVQATRRDSFSVNKLSLLISCASLTILFGLALALSTFTASTDNFSLFPAAEAQILLPNLQQFQFHGPTMALQQELQPYSPPSTSYSYFPHQTETVAPPITVGQQPIVIPPTLQQQNELQLFQLPEQSEQYHEPLLPILEEHQQPQTFPIRPQLEQLDLSPTIPPDPSFVSRDNTDIITPLTPPPSYPNIPSTDSVYFTPVISAVDGNNMPLPNGGSTYSNKLIISFDIPNYTMISNIPSTIFQCSLDGQAPFDCASPTPISNLTTGTHIFQVKHNDAALPDNNMVQTPSIFVWNLLAATSPPSVLSIPDEQKTPSLNPFQRTSQGLQQQESAPNNATLSTGVIVAKTLKKKTPSNYVVLGVIIYKTGF
jgi:hypothetical protein